MRGGQNHGCMARLRSQRWRETAEEKRELERLEFDTLNEVRQAAEVHRQVCCTACCRQRRSSPSRSPVNGFSALGGVPG